MPWVRALIYPSTCMTSSTGAVWSTPQWTNWTGSGTTNVTTWSGTTNATIWIDPVHMAAYRACELQQWRDEVVGQIDDLQRDLRWVEPRQTLARPHVRRNAEEVQRRDAEAKARELLLTNLTESQRETLRNNKWFVIEGRSGQLYRVRDAGHVVANIDVVERDLLGRETVLHRLCGHIGDPHVPVADHLLAQKLMLEADEDAFLRLANRHV